MLFPATVLFSYTATTLLYMIHPSLAFAVVTVTTFIVLIELLFQAQLLPGFAMLLMKNWHDQLQENQLITAKREKKYNQGENIKKIENTDVKFLPLIELSKKPQWISEIESKYDCKLSFKKDLLQLFSNFSQEQITVIENLFENIYTDMFSIYEIIRTDDAEDFEVLPKG